jgi:hypothetical protein
LYAGPFFGARALLFRLGMLGYHIRFVTQPLRFSPLLICICIVLLIDAS